MDSDKPSNDSKPHRRKMGVPHVFATQHERHLNRTVDAIRSGELLEALQMTNDVAKRARKEKDYFALGRALMLAGEIELLRGDVTKAEALCHESMRVFHKIQLWGGISRVHRLMAAGAEVRGARFEARRHISQAFTAAEAVRNDGAEADIRARNLFETFVASAALLCDDGELDAAIEQLHKAEGFASELSDPMLLGDYLAVKSRIEGRNDPDRSIELLHKAQRIFANNRLTLRAAHSFEVEGRLLIGQGDFQGARSVLLKAQKLLDHAATPDLERVQEMLGDVATEIRKAQSLKKAKDSAKRSARTHGSSSIGPTTQTIKALSRLLGTSPAFTDFCELFTESVVTTFGLATSAFVTHDLGGGSLRLLASFPPQLGHEELIGLSSDAVDHKHIELCERPSISLHLRIDPHNDDRADVEFLNLLRQIFSTHVTDDVQSDLEGGSWIHNGGILRHGMFVASVEMHAVLDRLQKAARSDCTVLITGESGTGKEHLARVTHDLSLRATGPYKTTNCAAVPPDLVESKLFGHKRGAFTGASSDNPGLFRSAHLGSLFLDEIGELPMSVQAKLLRALDSGEIEPLGHESTVRVDVRVIAATNRNLEIEVAEGRFRSDLFHRLNVVAIDVPPLRNRPADILPLAQYFLNQAAEKRPDGEPLRIHPSAERRLVDHSWPGNVRELKNVVTRALLLNGFRSIRKSDLHFGADETDVLAEAADSASDGSYDDIVSSVGRRSILETLRMCGGSRVEACRRLGLSRARFYRLLKQLEVDLTGLDLTEGRDTP